MTNTVKTSRPSRTRLEVLPASLVALNLLAAGSMETPTQIQAGADLRELELESIYSSGRDIFVQEYDGSFTPLLLGNIRLGLHWPRWTDRQIVEQQAFVCRWLRCHWRLKYNSDATRRALLPPWHLSVYYPFSRELGVAAYTDLQEKLQVLPEVIEATADRQMVSVLTTITDPLARASLQQVVVDVLLSAWDDPEVKTMSVITV